ncbi:MAG: NAD-dependent epimerase/dehydratase family protein [Patescibacteria group bacterium]
MDKDNKFWFGKRVLVTGGDGFVASHLIKYLLMQGSVVVSTVRHKRPLSTLQMICSEGELSHKPDIEDCDLLDFYALRRVCDRHQIDTIFHLAASAIVSDAANSPVSTIENNIMGTLNILEVARINKIPRVLIASSDKSYGDHASPDDLERIPYREDYALRGLDVYSASKVGADMLAQTYSYQFKVPVVIVRSCNIFGPGDLNFSRLIPKTIMCLLSKNSPVIHQGNEDVLREYIYVEDVISAYTLLAEKVADYYGTNNRNMPRFGRSTYGWAAFNVGTYTADELMTIDACEKIKSVKEVMTLLGSKIADLEPIIKEKAANFIEIPNQYLDAGKILQFGFKPQISFEEGLNRSITWYKNNFNHLERLARHHITH